ncbi:SWI/SNF complex subunit SMARCC2 [Echinococcus granulosus]|uniref:SWI:SNF complex subunit SMARCC2 n=1 Tax=Echinococcus granulosus TaxID=6210 RepID=A0A068WS90_ECHGR|nr:SWI/SNF complex subunit SMARCC2 [Echinococcus granulosus]CDS20511.1 SWI:SNF complex subunit SMARCC2 [Echinococcus granulosus]
MGLPRPNDCGIASRFYENPEIIANFDPVRTWLTRNHKKYTQAEPPTNKSLAGLCYNLLMFQEQHFGRNASSPKLPSRLFVDFKPGGSLCYIFLICLRYRHDQGWRKLDFSSPRLDKFMEMFDNIKRELAHQHLWSNPCVYFANINEPLLGRLREGAMFLGATIAKSPEESTHCIHPPPDNWPGDSRDDSVCQRFRPIFKEGRGLLLHWLFSPGSFDSWHTNLPVEWPLNIEPEPRVPGGTPWNVDARWLLYSADHREWMLEEDFLHPGGSVRPRKSFSYEEFLEAANAQQAQTPASTWTSSFSASSLSASPHIVAAPSVAPPTPSESSYKKKRKRSPSPSSESYGGSGGGVGSKKRRHGSIVPSGSSSKLVSSARKMKKEDYMELTPEDQKDENTNDTGDLTRSLDDPEPPNKVTQVAPGTPVSMTSRNSRTSLATADLSAGDHHINSDHTSEATGATDVVGGGAGDQAGAGDLSVIEQAHCIVVPSYSAWFDYNAIHAIERRSLPEFFNGKNKSKTPETYLAYRNFMIDTYRLNPQEYLTFTACRRNLTGDVCSVLRVHAFLEQWGLINYQVAAPLLPSGGASQMPSEAARLAVAASLGPPSTAHFNVLTDSASGLQPLGSQNQAAMATLAEEAAKQSKEQVGELGKTEGTDSETKIGVKPELDLEGRPSTVQPGQALPVGSVVGGGPPPSTGDPLLRSDQYLSGNSEAGGVAATIVTNQILTKGATKDGWTDQETLLLLEALEMYRDDWNKVAEHVGSRTQDECILHFLRLPIEDAYLEGDFGSICCSALADAAHPQPPFSKAGNPILSTVAFLAAVVDPRVAASAASAALKEYAQMREEVPAGLLHEHKARVQAAVRMGREVDPNKFGLDELGIVKSEDSKRRATGEGEEEQQQPKEETSESAEKPLEEMNESTIIQKGSSRSEGEAGQEVKEAETEEGGKSEQTTMEADEVAPVKGAAEDGGGSEVGAKKKSGTASTNSLPPNLDSLGTAAACALAAAATKARHLASVEEKRIKGLVAQLVETQLKKLDIKLKQFQELEAILEREHEMLEQARQQLMHDRQAFHMEVIKTMESQARAIVQQQQQQQVVVQQTAPIPSQVAAQPPPPNISLQQIRPQQVQLPPQQQQFRPPFIQAAPPQLRPAPMAQTRQPEMTPGMVVVGPLKLEPSVVPPMSMEQQPQLQQQQSSLMAAPPVPQPGMPDITMKTGIKASIEDEMPSDALPPPSMLTEEVEGNKKEEMSIPVDSQQHLSRPMERDEDGGHSVDETAGEGESEIGGEVEGEDDEVMEDEEEDEA